MSKAGRDLLGGEMGLQPRVVFAGQEDAPCWCLLPACHALCSRRVSCL